MPERMPENDRLSDVVGRVERGPAAAQQVPPDLERLIHERMRLGIVSALAVNSSLTFNELKALLKTTDGNLCIHARKLEEAAYITSNKSSDPRQPVSLKASSRNHEPGE